MMSEVKKAEFFTSPNLVAREPIDLLIDTRYGAGKKELKALKIMVSHLTSSYEQKVSHFVIAITVRFCPLYWLVIDSVPRDLPVCGQKWCCGYRQAVIGEDQLRRRETENYQTLWPKQYGISSHHSDPHDLIQNESNTLMQHQNNALHYAAQKNHVEFTLFLLSIIDVDNEMLTVCSLESLHNFDIYPSFVFIPHF